jgi:hypothetical protein
MKRTYEGVECETSSKTKTKLIHGSRQSKVKILVEAFIKFEM